MRTLPTLIALVAGGALVGCATQPQSTDSRQSLRRKPVPNLDRTYDWGSTPDRHEMGTHVPD